MGGAKGFASGKVGGKGTDCRDGANFATCVVFLAEKWRFLKDALWGTPPELALVDQGPWFHKLEGFRKGRWQFHRGGGRAKGFGSGEVGGKGTDPRNGANFATCVVLFLAHTKNRKMAFFEGCPVGWGGYPPELAWWTGALVAGEVGAGWQFQKKGEGWGLVGSSKEGQVQGRVGLVGSSTGGGKGSGGIQGLRFRGGRCVIFHRGGVPGEGWRVDLVTCSRRGLPRCLKVQQLPTLTAQTQSANPCIGRKHKVPIPASLHMHATATK